MAEMFGTHKKVFLGGTCNGDTWRERLKPMLDAAGIKYFDPVVPEWNAEAQANEVRECDFCLYVITPKLKGTFSVAEAVEDAVKRPAKCVFAVLSDLDAAEQWDPHALKSLMQVGAMVERNGGAFLRTLSAVADHLKRRADDEHANAMPKAGERYFAVGHGWCEVVAVSNDHQEVGGWIAIFPTLVTVRYPSGDFRTHPMNHFTGWSTFHAANGGKMFRRFVP